MKLTRPLNPVLRAYRELPVPDGEQAITNLAGNYNAKVLFLAEHPTAEAFENNIPCAGPAYQNYFAAMESADFAVSDMLFVPFSRFGKKPNKASTEHTFPFIKEVIPQSKIELVVCCGMTVFGFIFAGGRKTHARSIIGNVMYLPQLYTMPVLVMPDTNFLVPDPSNFREVRFANDKLGNIQNLTLNLKKFISEMPVNQVLRKLRQP